MWWLVVERPARTAQPKVSEANDEPQNLMALHQAGQSFYLLMPQPPAHRRAPGPIEKHHVEHPEQGREQQGREQPQVPIVYRAQAPGLHEVVDEVCHK